MMLGIKKIWVLTSMTLQIVDKPLTLAMKIMVVTTGSNGDAEVEKNSRPEAYPLGYSQTQLFNCNL
jgi:hypothetical protein